MAIISLDSETTGLDLHHGAKPFFVTSCDLEGNQTYWEWDVDPTSREPIIPDGDLDEIEALIGDKAGHTLILQNAKFDFAALSALKPGWQFGWSRVQDTLIAGHLLASSDDHDLTSLTLTHLKKNILKYEKALNRAVQDARRKVRLKTSKVKHWRIAKAGLPDMPSAGEKTWKFDTWLPRALAKHLKLPKPKLKCKHRWASNFICDECKGHQWWVVLKDYANRDSWATVNLWPVMKKKIQRRGLWEIYLERRKIPRIAYTMEGMGITLSAQRLAKLSTEYQEGVDQATAACVGVAKSFKFDLNLPRGGRNKQLNAFVFDVLKLPVVKETKKGNPSLDKYALEVYEATLPQGSPQLRFTTNLRDKRKRDTSIGFLKAYQRFWHPHPLFEAHLATGAPGSENLRRVTEHTADEWRRTQDKLIHSSEGKTAKSRGFPATVTGGRHQVPWYLLHPNLNPTGTNTLRWSSNNPNEQNISKQEEKCNRCEGKGFFLLRGKEQRCPKCKGEGTVSFNLRYCFGPAPGREWWSLDAKNIELRLPAYESGEEELISLFERPNEPPYYGSNHLLIFHTLHTKLWEAELGKVCNASCCKGKVVDNFLIGPHCKKKYASTWYQWTKNGNFAVQYGAVDKQDGTGTADLAYHLPGAQRIIAQRFAKQEALNQYWIRYAEQYGYVETMPDTRVNPKHGYPVMCTTTERGGIKPTVPLNYHVQSTAMWWMQMAMIACQEQLDDWSRNIASQDIYRQGYFMVMQVHDELVFDFPKRAHPLKNPRQSNLGRIQVIQKLMAQNGDYLVPNVPTPVSCEYHPETWALGIAI